MAKTRAAEPRGKAFPLTFILTVEFKKNVKILKSADFEVVQKI